MAKSVSLTARFVLNLVRDVVGTLRERWRRWYRRVIDGRESIVVGVDIFPFFERLTGVGWYEWNLLAALDRCDAGISYNLYAHTFLHPDHPPPPTMPGNRVMRYRVHQLSHEMLLPANFTLPILRALAEPLLRVLDGNDLLFAPNFFLHSNQLPYAPATVATVHDLAFAVMPRSIAPETLSELKRNLADTLFRAQRLIAVSDVTAEDLGEYLHLSPHRVHTIHEGLDPVFDTDEPHAAHDELELPERYLLFVSTLEPRKNVLGVLRAFRLLVEWGYGGDLVLIGGWGWGADRIRTEIETSPVRDRIVHLEYVERPLLPSAYAGAEALLFPSWLEGFGLPLLEAMACGTPVVTSGQSAMPEVAGPAAAYIDPARPHSIASAVAALLEDPSHRERLTKLGRERARRFSWQRAAEATGQVLRQAAGFPATGPDEYRVDERSQPTSTPREQ